MAAIDKYAEIRTKDNSLAARNERWNGARRLVVAILVSLGIIGVSALLFNTLLSDLPRDVYSPLYGFIALVIWVLVWNPIDILAFEWVPYARTNQLLAYMAKAEIVIKPWK
jgi:L-lactate permease